MSDLVILNNWEKARLAVAECKDIDEAKGIRDKASALKIYVRQAEQGLEVQNNVAEIKIRAERRIGEFSRELPTKERARTDLSAHHRDEQFKTQVLLKAGINNASRYEAVASIPEETFEGKIASVKENREELTTAEMLRVATMPHVAYNSGENEWYTPPEYISSAKKVMGTIDLDPASTEVANTIVGAATFYTKEASGLDKPWKGRSAPYLRKNDPDAFYGGSWTATGVSPGGAG